MRDIAALTTKRFHNRATAIEMAEVKRMEKKTGLPVFLTGDMNETTETDQKVTAGTAAD